MWPMLLFTMALLLWQKQSLLSSSYKGRNCIFIKEGLNPQYLEVLKTYCEGADLKIANEINENTACVIAQNPDFHGNIENLQYLSEQAHKVGALFIVCVVEPTSLAILEPPGNYGADIVVGEGQSFGIPINFGGPYLGFIAVKDFLLKKIPRTNLRYDYRFKRKQRLCANISGP